MLPYFKKHEHFAPGANEFHGTGGELGVERQSTWWPVLDVMTEAAKQDGLRELDDFNTGDNEGVGPYHVIVRNGIRSSTARAFLQPVRSRANLKVETHALTRAHPVRRPPRYRRRLSTGRPHDHRARRDAEVIVSHRCDQDRRNCCCSRASAPRRSSPSTAFRLCSTSRASAKICRTTLQMIMAYKLDDIGTMNQQYNSLFGKLGIALEYALYRKGPMSTGPFPLGIFMRSDETKDRADLCFVILPFSRTAPGMQAEFHRHPGITMSFYDCRPTSRGHIRLKSSDASTYPESSSIICRPSKTAASPSPACASHAASLAQPAFAPHKPVELRPGKEAGDDDHSLLEAFKKYCTTIYHPVGTAKMGRREDRMAVVDSASGQSASTGCASSTPPSCRP